jgi:hypothetical protein
MCPAPSGRVLQLARLLRALPCQQIGAVLSGGSRNVAPDLLSDARILQVVYLGPAAGGLPPLEASIGGI